jgi:ATP dependent DNA ligase domain
LIINAFIYFNYLIRNIAFDYPDSKFVNYPFEARYAQILRGIPQAHNFIVSDSFTPSFSLFLSILSFSLSSLSLPFSLLPLYIKFIIIIFVFNLNNIPAARLLCTGKKQLNQMVQNIINDGGEGVILRKPKSIYENGRSSTLIKLKVFLFPLPLSSLSPALPPFLPLSLPFSLSPSLPPFLPLSLPFSLSPSLSPALPLYTSPSLLVLGFFLLKLEKAARGDREALVTDFEDTAVVLLL